jgi:hypothetical protein
MSENVSSADNQQERLKLIGWIVGFTDGEGCFCVSINRNYKAKLGWQVMPEFVLTQGVKSLDSLKTVKRFFQCGRIFINRRHDNHKENLSRYCIRSLKDLDRIIIPFFKTYSLRTEKRKSFKIFSQVVTLMREQRLHLNLKGIERIAKLSAQINRQKIPKFLKSSETIRKSLDINSRDKI